MSRPDHVPDFDVSVGIYAATVLDARAVGSQYWFSVQAPVITVGGPSNRDLSVTFRPEPALSATLIDGVRYGLARAPSDSFLLVDGTGSMAGSNLDAAVEAARLYTNSLTSDDQLGLNFYKNSLFFGSFGEFVSLGNYGTVRDAVLDTIGVGAAAPLGLCTSVGSSLLDALDDFDDNADTNNWNMVLLSDGLENCGRRIEASIRFCLTTFGLCH